MDGFNSEFVQSLSVEIESLSEVTSDYELNMPDAVEHIVRSKHDMPRRFFLPGNQVPYVFVNGLVRAMHVPASRHIDSCQQTREIR
ncbi:MAG: hypothetical protein JWM43_1466 [Acidobacteriaceae bacterium]|nr:hypothetical protein [Acidobacteriaceae bacterium]